jgi:outer membrane lipoprotein-sorting protein
MNRLNYPLQRWVSFLAVSQLAVALCVVPAWAQSKFELPQLMQLLAQVKSGEASFTEKRSVAMLERTLEFSGRLSFEAPDTFVRENLKPRQERMAVVGKQMTMSMGSRSRTVPVDSVPEASVIVEAIRGTMTGNQDALEKHFTSAVAGTPQRWSLELVPREPRLRELISVLRLAGQQSVVRELVVTMADGDRSVMTIEPLVATNKPAAAASQ